MTSPPLPSRVRMWIARAAGAPVRHATPVVVFLVQAAHRLITLALWLLAARLAVGFFSYETGVARLLPWAMSFLNAALVCEFAGYWLARFTRGRPEEARKLLTPTLILIVLTALWMILDLATSP